MRRFGWLLLPAFLLGCPPSSRRSAPMESMAPPPSEGSAESDAAADDLGDEDSDEASAKEADAEESSMEEAFGEGGLGLEGSGGSADDDWDAVDEEAAPASASQAGGGAEPQPAPPPARPPSAPPPTPAPGAPVSKKSTPSRARDAQVPVAPASRWPDRVVTVWFGTDRAVDSSYPGGFGGAPGGELVVGTLNVSIPESHTTGVLERPSLFRLELSEDPNRHVVLGEVTALSESDFRASLAASGSDTALLFVHGFWNSFEDGALRAAQLAWDLGYPGAPALYSWGSAGSAVGYLTDASSVVEAEPHFDTFLDLLVQGTGVREVHVVAHSMGTRLATETLARRGREGRPGVSELVLAAPDIDVKHFENDLSEPLSHATERLTVYGSSTDQALAMSAQLNAMVRLGDASSGALSLAGLEGIDATPIESSMDGHSYIAHNPSVLADLSCLLAHVPVVDRPWLSATEGSWTFSQAPEGASCTAAP